MCQVYYFKCLNVLCSTAYQAMQLAWNANIKKYMERNGSMSKNFITAVVFVSKHYCLIWRLFTII